MKIVFDPAKDEANRKKHGLSLAQAVDVAIDVVIEDDRFDYGERRYRAFGSVDGVACCLVFAVRGGEIRAISLRRAHKKEILRHGRKSEK
jgi:uncharacterized DUF497 family protein